MPDGRFIVTQPSQPISVKTDEVRRTGSLTPGIAQCYGGEDARSHVFLHEESWGKEPREWEGSTTATTFVLEWSK